MAETIKTVFQEYTRLRLNGLDAPEAVRALHPYLQDFDKNTRDELARNMRAWENQRTEKISLLDREKLAKASEMRDAFEKIACPSCGKNNIVADSICYSCGSLLRPEIASSTAVLETQSPNDYNDVKFTDTDTLLFKIDDSNTLELRPQMGLGNLMIGRSKDDAPVDVDLSPFGGSEAGVSRWHASISYDEVSETLSLFDMGSTNGTYINGQLLHANERRTIRHGDELQFGTLKVRIAYKGK